MYVLRVLIFLASPLTWSCLAGGTASSNVPGPCAELNRKVIDQTMIGRSKEAEGYLSAALTRGSNDAGPARAGLVRSNFAALMGVCGHFADAEAFAGRAVDVIDRVTSADAPVLLRPLQILTISRIEQGKIGSARKAFQRMQVIPAEAPDQRALVHEASAVLLEKEGKLAEAESEYLAIVTALQDDGRSNGADGASALIALGSLYVKDHRLEQADPVLDRAVSILKAAPDAVPMDRVRVLNMRAVLDAGRGDWQKAEEELQGAVFHSRPTTGAPRFPLSPAGRLCSRPSKKPSSA